MKSKPTLEVWRHIRGGLLSMRGWSSLRFQLLGLSLCLVNVTALSWCLLAAPTAQAADADEELFDDKRGDTAMDQDTLDKAELAFFDGLTAYRAKKYEEAAEQFKIAYKLVPFRDLLFNVARAYEEQGDRGNAVKYYKLYLDTQPIDETQVIHRLRQLGVSNAGVDSPGAGPNVTATPTGPPPGFETEQSSSILTWSALGGGAVFMLVGTHFGLDALDQAESARAATGKRNYERFKSDAERSALWADISMTVGLAAIAGGVYLWLTESDSTGGVQRRTGVVGAPIKATPQRRVQWHMHADGRSATLGLFGTF